tara:strand:- start:36501 stop:36701 length:201 start_codon:yes stop_codon:yes gene_type:complete
LPSNSSGYIFEYQKVMIGSDETVEIFKKIDKAWFERDYESISKRTKIKLQVIFKYYIYKFNTVNKP